MPLYSDDELEKFPEYDDLKKAMRHPEKVIRFRTDRQKDTAVLAQVADLRNLQSLSISQSDVSPLLPNLGKLMDLQDLRFQACKISHFPESILALPNLRSLTIGNSSLNELPDEISCLSKLEELRFLQNQLRRIPESVGKLTRLKLLGISYNRLEELPDSITELVEIDWIFLDANRLQFLPERIGKLTQLRSLSLEHNQLRTLPNSVCDLRKLESLSLEGNPFESLPGCLSKMTHIKTLSIEAEKRSLFMDWSYRHSEKPPQIALTELKLFAGPEIPLFERFMVAIQEGGLSAVGDVISRAGRDAVKIEATEPDDYSHPGNSRLGGFPDLSSPTLFPKSDDLHWIFLAQFNLADLAPLNSYLPPSGLLSFFVDSTEALNAKVLFYQDDPGTLTTVRHGGADEMIAPDDDYTRTPHRATFERFISLPHSPPEGLESEQACEDYRKCEALHDGVDHHFNGYTFTQNESPQEQAAKEWRGRPDEWVPLLQLGWDDKVGFCFWDAGTLTFTIHQEDLRRWDFSRVHVTLESS